MDIHKLECVVSLARLKNVTRAAAENFIAQPTMSATITAVEQEVGVKLFNRSQREVTLTAAGESFSKAAVAIIDSYQAAVKEAQHLDSEDARIRELTIGFTTLSLGATRNHILATIKEVHPELNIRLFKTTLSDLSKSLYDGRADIVFSNQFEIRQRGDLNHIPIIETSQCVFVHRSHPLAQKESLTVDDLRGQRLLCASAANGSRHISAAAEVLRDAGIPYTDDSPIDGEEAIVSMVEAGLGMYPAARWYRYCFSDEIVALPVDIQVEHMFIVLAWHKHVFDEIAAAIADISRQVLTTDGYGPYVVQG
jgi:DNA-binding transcriptional LysR family regulator